MMNLEKGTRDLQERRKRKHTYLLMFLPADDGVAECHGETRGDFEQMSTRVIGQGQQWTAMDSNGWQDVGYEAKNNLAEVYKTRFSCPACEACAPIALNSPRLKVYQQFQHRKPCERHEAIVPQWLRGTLMTSWHHDQNVTCLVLQSQGSNIWRHLKPIWPAFLDISWPLQPFWRPTLTAPLCLLASTTPLMWAPRRTWRAVHGDMRQLERVERLRHYMVSFVDHEISCDIICFEFFGDTTISNRDFSKLVLVGARRSLCTAIHCQGHPWCDRSCQEQRRISALTAAGMGRHVSLNSPPTVCFVDSIRLSTDYPEKCRV